MHEAYIERFRKYVRIEASGCHVWTGALSCGYGQFGVAHARPRRAHRIAYEYAKGAIPEGLQIDHLCRNTRCVNPEHLEAVTPRTNTRRAYDHRFRVRVAEILRAAGPLPT